MLKYVDTKIVFAEVPNEVTLAINISNCPCHCEGCHSPYLAGDIGEILDEDALEGMVLANKGITCIAFMGGDSDPESINRLAEFVKKKRSISLKEWNNIRVAWYSGRDIQADEIDLKNFDYIKLGPYMEEYGPLTRRGTNQRFYWVCKAIHEYPNLKKEERYYTIDMTSEFWKDETKD